MPHINIKCYPGRTEEQKNKLTEEIVKKVSEIFNSPESSVSVSIVEVEKENWKEVYDNEIMADEKALYKKPGYKM